MLKNQTQTLFRYKKFSPQVIIILWRFWKTKIPRTSMGKRVNKPRLFHHEAIYAKPLTSSNKHRPPARWWWEAGHWAEGPATGLGLSPTGQASGSPTGTTLQTGRCGESGLTELGYTLAWHVFAWYQEPPEHIRWPLPLPLGKHSVFALKKIIIKEW